ncbi:hypothetical protein E2C01_031838 [Portunus trituberculatus]|uniref:Uncharacterized protein n=1 Tax=Portunus trituberculatus TaxID=210409 RepID=A0A5B7EZP5_PORTR|nr:hypothetical protein [Portunus trituberculatus]
MRNKRHRSGRKRLGWGVQEDVREGEKQRQGGHVRILNYADDEAPQGPQDTRFMTRDQCNNRQPSLCPRSASPCSARAGTLNSDLPNSLSLPVTRDYKLYSETPILHFYNFQRTPGRYTDL